MRGSPSTHLEYCSGGLCLALVEEGLLGGSERLNGLFGADLARPAQFGEYRGRCFAQGRAGLLREREQRLGLDGQIAGKQLSFLRLGQEKPHAGDNGGASPLGHAVIGRKRED